MEKKKKKNNWILIVIAIIVLFFLFGSGDNSEEDKTNSNNQKYERLEAEIIIINEMMIDIINRNTYEWTNVKIVANDYYTCIEGMTLESNGQFNLKTYQCKDSQGQGNIGILIPLEKIKIIADEGSKTEYFTYG